MVKKIEPNFDPGLRDIILHGDFKSENGGSSVSQTKKLNLEGRVEMVLYLSRMTTITAGPQSNTKCLYNWVKRYEENGKAGLEDRR